ncbi:hypothetical protein JRQ81_005500 [Phrynocephalus forsythii]|uniref:Uncharacterized protein n=1 Tax=Phrynocephalus forsythii TaxID=171643 RepID=A0A9Q1AVX2_9SAUR|nr:hypothetical protein JRQ81_005500 [Phrynocephalus forsythii]
MLADPTVRLPRCLLLDAKRGLRSATQLTPDRQRKSIPATMRVLFHATEPKGMIIPLHHDAGTIMTSSAPLDALAAITTLLQGDQNARLLQLHLTLDVVQMMIIIPDAILTIRLLLPHHDANTTLTSKPLLSTTPSLGAVRTPPTPNIFHHLRGDLNMFRFQSSQERVTKSTVDVKLRHPASRPNSRGTHVHLNAPPPHRHWGQTNLCEE